jgi:glycerate 2-kinase
VKVVIAPDGFGGTLSARQAAEAIAEGWASARPGDELVAVPLSDGGEGLLEVLATAEDRWVSTEVVGPLGHPVTAQWLLRADGSAVIETARACGLALVPPERRTPLLTTTYGVGQLVDAARTAGARHLLVGLGGSATVDGGAGALTGLGYRLRVEDGSGLKIGGDDLHRVERIERGWAADPGGIGMELLADVTTSLLRAAEVFGPQKGASPDEVTLLTRALAVWADVVERDLTGGTSLRDLPGTGAAGGLGFGLAAAFEATFVPGVARVADLVGFPAALGDAEVVVTGGCRCNATTAQGKVAGWVAAEGAARDRPVLAVAGRLDPGGPAFDDAEAASPAGPSGDPAGDVARAAERLAARR